MALIIEKNSILLLLDIFTIIKMKIKVRQHYKEMEQLFGISVEGKCLEEKNGLKQTY